MLKYNEPNPLTVFGLRRIEDHCPEHFVPVDFDIKCREKTILDWVWTNLSGRFYMGDHYYRNADGAIETKKRIAFEVPGEASMFALILDQLNRFDFDF